MNLNKEKFIKKILLFAIVILFAIIFFIAFNYAKDTKSTKEITYNEFIRLLENKEISKVIIDDNKLTITTNEKNTEYSGKTLYTANINDENLILKLNNFGVDYSGKNLKETTVFDKIVQWSALSLIIVIIIIPVLMIYLICRYISLKKENQKLLIQIKNLSEKKI